MYKLLIVDDEAIIREGMKSLIPWEDLGIETVLTAASSREALRLIEEHSPQLVITDINMPEMSGIEMLEKAYAIVPDLRAIVLTGYDYFEYARDALRLHVQDFLLKPVNEELLYESVRKQIETLDEKRAVRHSMRANSIHEQFELKSRIISLLGGKDTQDAAASLEADYHIQPDARFMMAVLVPDVDYAMSYEDRSLLYHQIHIFCMDEVDNENMGFTIFDEHNGTILILYLVDSCPLGGERTFRELLNLVRSEIAETLRAAVGTEVIGLRNISLSYQEAIQLLNRNDEKYQIELRLPQNMASRNRHFSELFGEIKGAVCANISNPSKVTKLFEAFMSAADEYGKPDTDVRKGAFRIISDLYYTCTTSGIPVPETFLGQAAASLSTATREECRELGQQYIVFMLASRENEINKMVADARDYIDHHLGDNMTVSDLAARFFVSANYFSRLFKKHMGEGCNDYIVRKRMEKAKSLLTATDLSAGRIANMVGYSDTNYFSMAFKKYCGMSPTSYRSSQRGG